MAKTPAPTKADKMDPEPEGPQGASVTVNKGMTGAKGRSAIKRVEIEVADNGGFLVSVFKKPSGRNNDLGWSEPEKHACQDKEALDDVLDPLFGIED